MISKFLQILGLQPRISKVFSRSLEQFILTVGENIFVTKYFFCFWWNIYDKNTRLYWVWPSMIWQIFYVFLKKNFLLFQLVKLWVMSRAAQGTINILRNHFITFLGGGSWKANFCLLLLILLIWTAEIIQFILYSIQMDRRERSNFLGKRLILVMAIFPLEMV